LIHPSKRYFIMKTIALFALTLVVYVLLDLSFINLFAKNFIQQQVGPLLAPKPDLVAGGVFYLIFIAGILYFCILPAQSGDRALLNGAFFGLVTYATYELGNKSLLNNWPLPLVLVDIAWGVFVGAVVSWAGYKLGNYFNWMPI
jgi:uncharacterized membrane protein